MLFRRRNPYSEILLFWKAGIKTQVTQESWPLGELLPPDSWWELPFGAVVSTEGSGRRERCSPSYPVPPRTVSRTQQVPSNLCGTNLPNELFFPFSLVFPPCFVTCAIFGEFAELRNGAKDIKLKYLYTIFFQWTYSACSWLVVLARRRDGEGKAISHPHWYQGLAVEWRSSSVICTIFARHVPFCFPSSHISAFCLFRERKRVVWKQIRAFSWAHVSSSLQKEVSRSLEGLAKWKDRPGL